MEKDFFGEAIEAQKQKRENGKEVSSRIKAFAEKEQPNRKSIEHRDLKRKISEYAKLMAKVSKAEADPENERNPIETAFARVNSIVGLLRDMGHADLAKEYFFLLNNLNVKLVDEEPIVKDVAGLDSLFNGIKANIEESNELAESVKKLAEEAESANVCSSSRFSKLLKVIRMFREKTKREDAEDKLQEEYLLGNLVSSGADAVSELIK